MSAEHEDSTPDWSLYNKLIEEENVPLFGFRVVTSIKPDGTYDVSWDYTIEGNVTLGQMVGMIESAKLELAHQFFHDNSGGLE